MNGMELFYMKSLGEGVVVEGLGEMVNQGDREESP